MRINESSNKKGYYRPQDNKIIWNSKIIFLPISWNETSDRKCHEEYF